MILTASYWRVMLAAILGVTVVMVESVGSSLEDGAAKWSRYQMDCIDSIHRDSANSQVLCEKSLEFAQSEGSDSQILESLENLAVAHSRAGRKAEALQGYLRKIDRLHKLNDDRQNDDMARTLMVAARISEELGDQEAALSLLDEASKVGADGAYKGDIAAAKADYWVNRGRFNKAEQNYVLAVDLCGAAIGCKVSALTRYAQMLEAADRHAEANKIQTQIGIYLTELDPLQTNDANQPVPR